MTNFIVILAVWRITMLFVEEDGIFDIFKHIRAAFEGSKWFNPSCFWCTSIWVSFIIVCYQHFSTLIEVVVYTCFYSAGAILVAEIEERLSDV